MNDSFLQEQGVSGALIESVRRFRESYPVAEGLENRMSTPEIPFFGKEILEMAIAALLQGENLADSAALAGDFVCACLAPVKESSPFGAEFENSLPFLTKSGPFRGN